MKQTLGFAGFLAIFTVGVAADTACAQSLSQGQDALRRSQLEFYNAAKANPKLSPAELGRLRDDTQRSGATAWARGVAAAMADANQKNVKKGKANASQSQGEVKAPVVPAAIKRSNSTPDQPGINGAEVPGMLEFPGNSKK